MYRTKCTVARYVGTATGIMMFKYTAEMQDFIRNNAYGKRWDELADLFNAEFGTNKTPRQIQSQAHDIGVRNGIQQKAHCLARYRPVGSTRLDKDGYVVIKVADPCTWRRAQLVEWEKYHEPIDIRKDMLLFLDGNRQNYHISNLYKIPRKYISTLNKYELWKYITPETIESVMAIVKLGVARWEAEKEKYGGHRQAQNARNIWRYYNVIKKDPESLERLRKRSREYQKERRQTDPEYRDRINELQRQRRKNNKVKRQG